MNNSEKNDVDNIEEIKPQYYHNAKKIRVVVITSISIQKNNWHLYKIIPYNFEDIVLYYINGKQDVNLKVKYVKLIKDFIKKEAKHLYDLVII
jgi:hypothetical protein